MTESLYHLHVRRSYRILRIVLNNWISTIPHPCCIGMAFCYRHAWGVSACFSFYRFWESTETERSADFPAHSTVQCGAPVYDSVQLVYISNNYGLWYANNHGIHGVISTNLKRLGGITLYLASQARTTSRSTLGVRWKMDKKTRLVHGVGMSMFIWLVVSTPLRNMKVNGKDYPWLSHILWKIKHIWNHQPVMYDELTNAWFIEVTV